MSYIALATDAFDAVTRFYGQELGFPITGNWDRAHGRGRRFDLDGLTLEILDNTRERRPLALPPPGDRFHVVIETRDIAAAHSRLQIPAPSPRAVSWGATLFQIRDPDGVPVTFLTWERRPRAKE
jgi:catechol 2,3-dioxygenase-like lactoylglutathione lyase family enzyme